MPGASPLPHPHFTEKMEAKYDRCAPGIENPVSRCCLRELSRNSLYLLNFVRQRRQLCCCYKRSRFQIEFGMTGCVTLTLYPRYPSLVIPGLIYLKVFPLVTDQLFITIPLSSASEMQWIPNQVWDDGLWIPNRVWNDGVLIVRSFRA